MTSSLALVACSQLSGQCKRLNNDLKQEKRKGEELEKEAGRIDSQTAELEMKNDSGHRFLKVSDRVLEACDRASFQQSEGRGRGKGEMGLPWWQGR